MTCLAWHVWCELVLAVFDELLLVLPDRERDVIEKAFDAEYWRLLELDEFHSLWRST